jgi:hypothetical protein
MITGQKRVNSNLSQQKLNRLCFLGVVDQTNTVNVSLASEGRLFKARGVAGKSEPQLGAAIEVPSDQGKEVPAVDTSREFFFKYPVSMDASNFIVKSMASAGVAP